MTIDRVALAEITAKASLFCLAIIVSVGSILASADWKVRGLCVFFALTIWAIGSAYINELAEKAYKYDDKQ